MIRPRYMRTDANASDRVKVGAFALLDCVPLLSRLQIGMAAGLPETPGPMGVPRPRLGAQWAVRMTPLRG
jgi:hypothetical protein